MMLSDDLRIFIILFSLYILIIPLFINIIKYDADIMYESSRSAGHFHTE